MNKRQRKVFTLLRTKTKAIGLNRKELEGLALKIDKNLTLEEDASDEDVDAAIEEAIDAAIPFLEVSQSVAQRSIQTSIQRYRDKHGVTDDDDDDDDDDSDNDDQNDDDGDRNTHQRGKGKKNHRTNKDASEDSELVKLIKKQNEAIEALKGQIDTLQGDRVHDTRKTKLKKLVGEAGVYGKSVLKQFDLMTFKDDDAFDDYLDEVQKDLDDINQERANAGLKKLGEVPSGDRKKSPENKSVDVMSDDDVIALAGGTPQSNQK